MQSSDLAAGDIVVVPFPYSDRFAEKRRPALVVSGSAVHAQGLVWLVMITSAKQSQRQFDHLIRDLSSTGLGVASTIRPIKIACLEADRILRKAGVLQANEVDEIYKSLHQLLDLQPLLPLREKVAR